jgi:hypothetical protein
MPTRRKYASNAERQAAYRARRSSLVEVEPWQSKQSSSGEARIPSRPGYRRWEAMLSQAQSLTRSIVSEMAVYHDARSEDWQCSERAESFAEKIEALEEIAVLMDDLSSTQPDP